MQVSKSTAILVAILILGLVAAVAFLLGKDAAERQEAPSTETAVSKSATAESEITTSEASVITPPTPTPTPRIASNASDRSFSTNERALIEADRSADASCRGGDPSSETDAACERRDSTIRTLIAAGICWGREGEAYAEHEYHRCGPNSIR